MTQQENTQTAQLLPDAALWNAYGEGRADERTELLAEEQRNKMREPTRRRLTGELLTTVDPYGFDMVCTFEYEPGEAMILWPTEQAHPGSPSHCNLIACCVNGQDIYDMLDDQQIERIEDLLLEGVE